MSKHLRIISLALFILSFLVVTAQAGKRTEISETFEKKDRIIVKTVSGDCIVERSDSDRIELEVENHVSPRDSFDPQIRERGNTLRLTERMLGSNSGSSKWFLKVPDGVEIRFSTASGDLVVSDLDILVTASTASGDIEIRNCTGEFEISTASGDIDVDKAKGYFELSTASGDIEASEVTLTDIGKFSTASGTAEVILGESPAFDMSIGSASGDAILNFNGHEVTGTFEFLAKRRSGDIRCPFDFDEEETIRKWHDRYDRKVVDKGEEPFIEIHTASGRAELLED